VINDDGRPTIVDTPLKLIFKMGQGLFHFLFCLSRQLILCLRLYTTCHPSDYPRYRTNNLWCTVDAQYHDGAGRVLQSVFPIQAGKNALMTECNLSAVWLRRTHDQKSLTLCRRPFSHWGWEGIAICFAYNGGQRYIYDWLQRIGGVITHDAWPKINSSLLTLIFKMG